jgi:diguanylate cyclase (GGDEF)-like protein/PAS domain S-box-containing protein
MRLTSRLLCLLALILLSVSGMAFSEPRSITVVLDDDYPPYSFRDAQGKLQGIVEDRWALWSQKTGIVVDLQGMDWNLALARMGASKADVIDTIFRSPEREKVYDFSQPYATIDVPAFFHQSISGITDADSLHGFTIGAKDKDVCVSWLNAHGIDNIKLFPSYESMVAAAAGNDVRVFCMDKPQAGYLLTKHHIENDFRFSPPLYSGQLHWATHKGNAALHQRIQQGFSQISDAELHAIDEKWLGSTMEKPGSNWAIQFSYALLASLTAAFILFLWNWSLRSRVTSRTKEVTTAMDALQSSRQHYRALVNTVPVGVFETDKLGNTLYVNDRALATTGSSREQALKVGWQENLHPEDVEDVTAAWREAIEQQQDFQMEFRFLRPDGTKAWVLSQAFPQKNETGEVTHYIGCFTDISERKGAEDKIRFLAYHDPLTELPNRLLMRDRFDLAQSNAGRTETKLALLLLDLDHFKTINDTLGHPTGDGLLCAVAGRLETCLRDTDTICRQGGDEFLILLNNLRSTDEAGRVATKILDRLAASFPVEGHELSTSISIGIAIYPDDGKNFDTLLKQADTAMYHAKEAGRNTYHFFTEQMNHDSVEHLQLRTHLARAVERNELRLYYQPQVDLTTGNIIGVEALIRWQHPEKGLIPPGLFIPIAENSGLIVSIGEWVLQEACRQAAAWQTAGLPELTVAVNLSAIQFKRSDLKSTVIAALAESGLAPERLELELTESILIQDTENVLTIVTELKELGIKLSIDDFGTGYSSLAYLRRLDVDKLKIDQSFVRDLNDDADDAAIVRAIIQMAHSLNLSTIAEGVENQEQADSLLQLQCDELQGYHLGRPMPPDDFVRHLATWGKS